MPWKIRSGTWLISLICDCAGILVLILWGDENSTRWEKRFPMDEGSATIKSKYLKKKALQKATTNKPKPTKQKAICHPHETPSKTLFTPILPLSPYHGRNKRQISCRTEREPDLMLWGEEILIKKWHLRSRREEKAMGNGGKRIKAVEQRQLLATFSSLQSGLCGPWWCFSTWEWKASPTSGRCHQLRSSGQLRRTNQCRIYPWQGQSGKKEIWIFSLHGCFLD